MIIFSTNQTPRVFFVTSVSVAAERLLRGGPYLQRGRGAAGGLPAADLLRGPADRHHTPGDRWYHAHTQLVKGPPMVPRSRNAITTPTLRRSPEPLWVCVGF